MTTVANTPTKPRRRGCITLLAIALILAVVAAALAMSRPELFGRGKQTVTAESLGASFHQIAELSTEEYAFTRVGKFDEEGYQIIGHTVPFTGKNFLVTYKGRVTAGIKNAELIDVTVNDQARTITIDAPKVSVIDTTIDPDSVTVMDQSLNPLNQLKIEDVSGFLAGEEKAAEKEAVDNGLLDRATDRTEELLRNHGEALTESTAMSDYTVNVQWK